MKKQLNYFMSERQKSGIPVISLKNFENVSENYGKIKTLGYPSEMP